MLDNKVIVVAGACGTLGRAFCRGILDAGGRVVVADLQAEPAQKLADEFRTEGLPAIGYALDICRRESIDGLIADASHHFGTIDAVVNSAYPRNAQYGAKFENVSYESFCENLSLHLGGYYLLAQRFALHFAERGCGNVVSLASIYGTLAPRFGIYNGTEMTMPVEYAAIKAGIIQLTRYLARYFENSGVRFNCMSPGGVLEGQPQPFLDAYRRYCTSKGMLDVKDVIGTLLFLLSDDSRFMNGQNLVIDDGFSI
jgi:NAD(P)-dependent dehydrogenase (short-subunit alcohol dehydrogenase family)